MNRPLYLIGYALVAVGAVDALVFATTIFGLLYGVVFIGLGLTFALHGRTAE